MRFVLEQGVFASGFHLGPAARRAGHRVSTWDDGFWETGLPAFPGERVLFSGALANAARIAKEKPWLPGAFCAIDAFFCSRYWPTAERWLLSQGWSLMTVRGLLDAPPPFDPLFVRPDSPLKPFSGRVLTRNALSLSALDFGFYYDDPDLPVIIAPVRAVQREWRFVVADGTVVTGASYAAEGRRSLPEAPSTEAWAFAQQIASKLPPPEPIYVLDVCASQDRLYLLELNPFSGADLYGCDPDVVVRAISAIVER